MASRIGLGPTRIWVVTWLVAESITATAFESVVVTKSCGLPAVVPVLTTGRSTKQASASAVRRTPRRKVRRSIEFLIDEVLGFRFMAFSPFRVFCVHPFQKKKPRRIAKKCEKPKKTGAEL